MRMYCENCGKMNGDVPGKAPFEYFKVQKPQSVCVCSDELLELNKEISRYRGLLDVQDRKLVRLANYTSPGGRAEYIKEANETERLGHIVNELEERKRVLAKAG